jgi:hypothetical protein
VSTDRRSIPTGRTGQPDQCRLVDRPEVDRLVDLAVGPPLLAGLLSGQCEQRIDPASH